MDMRNHLLDVRNSLIGHDDHDMIDPKLITLVVRPQDNEGKPIASIPVSMTVLNMCLAHPLELESIQKILDHVAMVHKGIESNLYMTLDELQKRAAKYPSEAEELVAYSEVQTKPAQSGSNQSVSYPVDYAENAWFQIKKPYEGYHYHNYRFSGDFWNQEVELPDGAKNGFE